MEDLVFVAVLCNDAVIHSFILFLLLLLLSRLDDRMVPSIGKIQRSCRPTILDGSMPVWTQP